MKAFRMNVSRCNGCHSCQIACKDEHVGNNWMPYAWPQPEWGQFWCKVLVFERGSLGAAIPGDKNVRMHSNTRTDYVALLCQHCVNAPCISGCPYNAISTRADGIVWIDPKKCTGCQLCISTCPYGVIYYNAGLQLAQKCTGCAHLLDRESWKWGARCADNCCTEALQFGEESELNLTGTATLYPEFGLTTRVKYLDLPMGKRYVSGTVYNPSTNDVIEGATCTLSGAGSGSITSDEWGDFWFDKLSPGIYTITISASGKTKTVSNIDLTEKDGNVGDIALT